MLAALLLLAAAPASAVAPPLTTTIAPATRASARALAEVVSPREIMFPLNMKWGERAVLAMPEHAPDSKQLESEYPGIHRAMWLAAEAELRRQMEADLLKLWSRLESLYLAELAAPEIDGLLRFYRTPTGQRMIGGLYGNIDLNDPIASMAKSADGQMSEQSLSRASDEAKLKTVSQLKFDEADLKLLVSIMPLQRLRSVGAKVQQATSEWFNEEDPDGQQKIDALMTEAAARFMGERDAKK